MVIRGFAEVQHSFEAQQQRSDFIAYWFGETRYRSGAAKISKQSLAREWLSIAQWRESTAVHGKGGA